MIRSLPLAALLASSLPVAAAAADRLAPEPGVWWELTSQMSFSGKNVPAELQGKPQTSTSRECLPRKIPDRAPPETGDCTVSDYRRAGSKVSFKLACPGGVTGETELVWTSDTYSGTARMRGDGMENRISVQGKKVGGECDANEKARDREAARRAVEESAKQARDAGEADAEAEPADPAELEPAGADAKH